MQYANPLAWYESLPTSQFCSVIKIDLLLCLLMAFSPYGETIDEIGEIQNEHVIFIHS